MTYEVNLNAAFMVRPQFSLIHQKTKNKRETADLSATKEKSFLLFFLIYLHTLMFY